MSRFQRARMLAAMPVLAWLMAPAIASAAEDAACTESVTVFQDVSKFGRKDRAADNMTRRHRTMAAEGWVFKDMEVYTENGDLEGFYLSYSRPADCERLRAAERD